LNGATVAPLTLNPPPPPTPSCTVMASLGVSLCVPRRPTMM